MRRVSTDEVEKEVRLCMRARGTGRDVDGACGIQDMNSTKRARDVACGEPRQESETRPPSGSDEIDRGCDR